ncbi:uncharacterized protein LOC134215835 [Armigeres subalbatus]|uniref:uncharacterized protein LOC134215835 n=1 Tax=Armigeres subalbatus TaxID=124917 RepID=UPI002ED03227
MGMISKKTVCIFLCSTMFIQYQSCSPVPTNTKIRNDGRRKSVESTTDASLSSTESTKTTTSISSSSSASSTIPTKDATEYTPIAPDDAKHVKLEDSYKDVESEHDKVKREIVPKSMAVPGRRFFKPESREEEEMELAETHLFRPLFKYQSVDAQRRHIRRQSSSTTTQRTR